jgi:hypothetical protein
LLRQLIGFQSDVPRFIDTLKEKLGPEMSNISLLFQGVPELEDLLTWYEITAPPPSETLTAAELRTRFQSLVETVFAALGETRLLCLVSLNFFTASRVLTAMQFLDDMHLADES